MARRYYSSTAVETTLTSGISDSATTIPVASTSGFPASTPYTLILDEGTVSEEIVEVTGVASLNLTVTRGVDGTSAVAHSNGGTVKHGVSARDFDEANDHVNDTSNPHGVTAADVGAVAKSDFTAKGSLLAASAASTPANLPVGTDGQVLVADSNETLGVKWAAAAGGGSAPGLLTKADLWSVCLSKTGAGTAQVKAGTKVLVGETLVDLATATTITMPSLTSGTDYYVYVKDDGTVQAVAATGSWPTPVAAPPANSQLIGGFHYAPGGNATGTSGGNTTPGINEYSMWDLKWRPTSLDPRGMTLVADAFWMDIYLLNRDPDTNGTSKNGVDIADGATGGTTTALIPAKFGGNGTSRYALQDWWSTAECLMAYGKRLPTVVEMATAAYGVTENASRGSDPVTTGLGTSNAGSSNTDEKFTSKWGVIQASGVMNVWGQEHGGGTAAASWANTNGGRGQVYQQENAVRLGGTWSYSGNSGSRSALWSTAPSFSNYNLGGRGACDHMMLV